MFTNFPKSAPQAKYWKKVNSSKHGRCVTLNYKYSQLCKQSFIMDKEITCINKLPIKLKADYFQHDPASVTWHL